MNTELIITQDTLSIGQVANRVASNYVFADYTSRKSDNTLRRHKADLAKFTEYLCACQFFIIPALPQKELEEWYKAKGIEMLQSPELWQGITWGIVKGFVEWQLKAGYAIGSINNRLSTIKIYSMLAVQAGYIEVQEGYLIKSVSGYAATEGKNVDKKRDITRLGKKKDESTTITKAQAEQLKKQPDTPTGRRNRLIMNLLLEHGLRVSELSLLQISDFDRDTCLLSFYRPKVDSPAIPHLLKNGSLKAMLDYLDNDAIGDTFLLRGSRKSGKLDKPGMAEQNINSLVTKLGEAIGLENLSPHDCRHYCASKLARQGKSVRELMDFFGWTSASTAMRYVDSARYVEGD